MLKKPQIPSTELAFSIPVADDRTTIEDVVEERPSFLRLDQQRLMVLDFSVRSDRREEVGERLQVRPTADFFSTRIGHIELPGQEFPTRVLSLRQLLGQEFPDATVAYLPAADFSEPFGLSLDGIHSAVVEQGGVGLGLTNGLPMGLVGLKAALVDHGSDGALVDELEMGRIAPGESVQAAFVLDGKEISGELAVVLSGATEEATEVEFNDDSGLVIAIALRPLVLGSVTGVIPPQEFADRQALEFPDDRIQIRRAVIAEGNLTLQVRNDLPAPVEMELRLDELEKPDGTVNAFAIDRLPPGEAREVRFSLAENQFAPHHPLELQLSYRGRMLASNDPVTITADSGLEIAASTENLIFSRVEGVLNRVELPVEPMIEEVDFPQGLDHVAIDAASMKVHLTSAVSFRSRVVLDIRGTNSAGATASLRLVEIFERGNPDHPASITLEPNPDELTGFLNALPSKVRIQPTVLLGDGMESEVIEPSHWVQLDSVRFVAPARFQIEADTRIRRDPIFRELQDEEVRRRIERNLLDARVITHIESHLPLGVKLGLRATSWRAVVRELFAVLRIEAGNGIADRLLAHGWSALSAAEAAQLDDHILQHLVTANVWEDLKFEDRKSIQRQLEVLLDQPSQSLQSYDAARLLALLEQEGGAASREAFSAMLIGSLPRRNFGRHRPCWPSLLERFEVEDFARRLLGRDLSYARQLLRSEIDSAVELATTLQQLEEDELWGVVIKYYVYRRPELRVPQDGAFAVEAAPVDEAGRVVRSLDSRQEFSIGGEEVAVLLRKGGTYTGVLIEFPVTDGQIGLYGQDYVKVTAAAQVFVELNEELVR